MHLPRSSNPTVQLTSRECHSTFSTSFRLSYSTDRVQVHTVATAILLVIPRVSMKRPHVPCSSRLFHL
jgi:hypothetical protein